MPKPKADINLALVRLMRLSVVWVPGLMFVFGRRTGIAILQDRKGATIINTIRENIALKVGEALRDTGIS